MIKESVFLDYILLMGAILTTVGVILVSVITLDVIKDVFKK